jgi:2,4-dienoyl-CoA reductase-like NADH-dependent reductase (Old Yellow Enzyme family)
MIQLDHLFSPLTTRGVTMRNRIFSTGHQTLLAVGEVVSPGLIA